MIDLEKSLLDEVKQILNSNVPQYKTLVFGSRITRNAKKFSDIDIALVGPKKIDWREIEALKDAFSESDLPIIVDIVDYNSVSGSFRAIINKNHAFQ